MPTLAELLSTGSIHPLQFGKIRTAGQQAIGTPEDEGFCDDGISVYDKYGDYQLLYERDQLIAVLCNLTRDKTDRLLIQDWSMTKSTSPNEFFDFCDAHLIDWEIEQKYTYHRQLCIRTCDQVLAYFDLDRRELQIVRVQCQS